MGLGIDEKTALIPDGSTFEVVGEGTVTVVDAGGMGFSLLPYARRGDPLTLHDVRLHVISNGFRFDLAARRPMPEENKERVEENAAGAERAAKPEEDEAE